MDKQKKRVKFETRDFILGPFLVNTVIMCHIKNKNVGKQNHYSRDWERPHLKTQQRSYVPGNCFSLAT